VFGSKGDNMVGLASIGTQVAILFTSRLMIMMDVGAQFIDSMIEHCSAFYRRSLRDV
jgi:hypothetical protein